MTSLVVMGQFCVSQVLGGLIFSCFGDAFMVWKSKGYFIHGVAMFAIAQVIAALDCIFCCCEISFNIK